MKTNILFSILLFFSMAAPAQVLERDSLEAQVIGQVNNMVNGSDATLTRHSRNQDTTFTLWYIDAQHAKTDLSNAVTFKATPEDLSRLHNIFLSVFQSGNIENKSFTKRFTLGNDLVTVSNNTRRKKVFCQVSIKDGYFYLNKSQVNQLFGKLKE